MSKGTQLWPGERMREFFRIHVRRTATLKDEDAEKLVDALGKAVNFMRVWEMPEPLPPQAMEPAMAAGKGKGPAPEEKPFDPYAFSAMVTLSRAGKDGLMKRLADIKSAEHLKALAEAQHLAIDRNLKKADELRKAIIAATEQRLADRKAAAS